MLDFVRGLFFGVVFCFFVGAWVLPLTFVRMFMLRYFLSLLQVVRIFYVCFAVCTGVVGVKRRQEAVVTYHAQDGPAGTP